MPQVHFLWGDVNAIGIKENTITLCHYLGSKIYKFIGGDLNCIHTANSINLTGEFSRGNGPPMSPGERD